jgi:hypothetical protein
VNHTSTKRTSRKMKGSHEDSGRWIKCWNCGFPIDLTKLHVSKQGDGKSYSDAKTPSEPCGTKDITLTIETVNMADVLIKTGADGNPITDYYTPRLCTVTSGCPCCGTHNLP